MNARRKTPREMIHGATRPPLDPTALYLGVSTSLRASGAIVVHGYLMDPTTRRMSVVLLREGEESRVSRLALTEWLAQGVEEMRLDLQDQMRLF